MVDSFANLQWIIFLAITLIAWIGIFYGSRLASGFKKSFGNITESRLDTLYLFVDGNKVFFYYILGLIALPIIVWFVARSIPLVIMLLITIAIIPKFAYKIMRKRFIDQLESSLPDALAQMSGSMRVGASLLGSIEAMVAETKGPLSKEFGQVLKECRVGISLEDALNSLDLRVKSENLSLIIAATNISRDVGGNLGETYERMGEMLRQKLSLEARINALTAQGKMQGIVVGFLPVGICLVMFYMEPDTMSYMVGSLFGWISMAVIGVLLTMGGFMIKKIVSIDV